MDLTGPPDPDPPTATSSTVERAARSGPGPGSAGRARPRAVANPRSGGIPPGTPGYDTVPGATAPGRDVTPEFASMLIERIFDCGLLLSGVSSAIERGPASEHLASAVAELNLLISQIRRAVLTQPGLPGRTPGPGAGSHGRSPSGWLTGEGR